MEAVKSPSQALGQADEKRRDQVTITVDGQQKSIHRGHQPVSEIKRVGGVPQADVLEQVLDGKLVPLDDDGGVVIKGNEVFISHPRDSASS